MSCLGDSVSSWYRLSCEFQTAIQKMLEQNSESDDSEEIGWEKEAQSIIKEFKSCVKVIEISDLPSTNSRIFFNLETKEGKKFCIELSASGFRICSKKFNETSQSDDEGTLGSQCTSDEGCHMQFYETLNALLDRVSPQYRSCFTEQLIKRLSDKIQVD